jgi:hypothetical protein
VRPPKALHAHQRRPEHNVGRAGGVAFGQLAVTVQELADRPAVPAVDLAEAGSLLVLLLDIAFISRPSLVSPSERIFIGIWNLAA